MAGRIHSRLLLAWLNRVGGTHPTRTMSAIRRAELAGAHNRRLFLAKRRPAYNRLLSAFGAGTWLDVLGCMAGQASLAKIGPSSKLQTRPSCRRVQFFGSTRKYKT